MASFRGCAGNTIDHVIITQDEDWEDEDNVNPLNKDEIAFLSGMYASRNTQCLSPSLTLLSDMLGPRAGALDEDNIPDDNDDEDLKNDPISQMDMTVRLFPSSPTSIPFSRSAWQRCTRVALSPLTRY